MSNFGLPPVDHDGAVCVVGGVSGADEVRCDVWIGVDVFVEFGADCEGGMGRVRHGAVRCGRIHPTQVLVHVEQRADLGVALWVT